MFSSAADADGGGAGAGSETRADSGAGVDDGLAGVEDDESVSGATPDPVVTAPASSERRLLPS